ncbi:protein spinster homolog 2 isoform X4 [Oncorhynchus mykiss]|uniref:protein spinster homolog 2 isoform X4 n=1 Tax=Oncorhynchus mykiss TaxID=8022 RepID=UPI0018789911|nr:protein spinster homolog 2 isoform X4 [Oncorhynchus mykiss]
MCSITWTDTLWQWFFPSAWYWEWLGSQSWSKRVLLDIQRHFNVSDSGVGLLQTVFICSFMVAAPIFGYLGDRFNRKIILSCGIFFWSAVTLSSSFITKEYYWLFVLSRGLVGIGESSYSSISPTIIGDLFTNNSRTMMLSVFYLAIPLGSGLGYILGSSAKEAAGDWHWALRVSPVLGMTAGTLILFFVPEPKRGHADQLGGRIKHRTSWLCDMKALAKNRSYVFSSLASAAVSFATGAFGMWIPLYLFRAQVVQKTAEACTKDICSSKDSLIFGAITCVTGLLGVVIGAATTRLCRQKTERADPLVCAVSMLGSAIFVCLIFVVAKKSIIGAYVCIFIGETLLFLNWAITADILMYVVIPTRRATAVAFQGFTSHLLGDAGSPYLIGLEKLNICYLRVSSLKTSEVLQRYRTPSRRATLGQCYGSSSVWVMPSCSVPSSSSWVACSSWQPPSSSSTTGTKQRNNWQQ